MYPKSHDGIHRHWSRWRKNSALLHEVRCKWKQRIRKLCYLWMRRASLRKIGEGDSCYECWRSPSSVSLSWCTNMCRVAPSCLWLGITDYRVRMLWAIHDKPKDFMSTHVLSSQLGPSSQGYCSLLRRVRSPRMASLWNTLDFPDFAYGSPISFRGELDNVGWKSFHWIKGNIPQEHVANFYILYWNFVILTSFSVSTHLCSISSFCFLSKRLWFLGSLLLWSGGHPGVGER